MATVPGSCGYPIIGDNSLGFYRDPEKFVANKIEETKSRVFQCRLLNKKTVFICSHKETKEVLTEKEHDFDHGYKDFIYNSYGDNILFENGESATILRRCIFEVLSKTGNYKPLIDGLCDNFFKSFSENLKAVNIYEVFKQFMTKLCLELFLGFNNDSTETANTISEVATLHWHGIISLPVNIKIPLAGKTGWHKAMEAKETLLQHIRARISKEKISNNNQGSCNVFQEMLKAPFTNSQTDVEQHILLFVSALIPKAFSSIITSFLLELSGDDKRKMRDSASSDCEFHKRALLEAQRLHPPFFGGRRITNKDTVVGRFKIPKGYALVYVSQFAHRDPNAFLSPDVFSPNRWLGNPDEKPQIFTFGGGKRCCVGQDLIQYILIKLTKTLLENYNWFVVDAEKMPDYKLLPVARPSELPLLNFVKK